MIHNYTKNTFLCIIYKWGLKKDSKIKKIPGFRSKFCCKTIHNFTRKSFAAEKKERELKRGDMNKLGLFREEQRRL